MYATTRAGCLISKAKKNLVSSVPIMLKNNFKSMKKTTDFIVTPTGCR